MPGSDRKYQSGWRRLIGWLAAYLLVFHFGFVGASTGHFFAPAANPVEGHLFCLNGDGAPAPADLPAQPAHGKVHCALCAGGGSLMLSAVANAPPPLTLAIAMLAVSGDQAAPPSADTSHRSRAPPLT